MHEHYQLFRQTRVESGEQVLKERKRVRQRACQANGTMEAKNLKKRSHQVTE
jgi:hypothetical protein